MNFLNLSAVSEEERRIISEILSDTSVVNITSTVQYQAKQYKENKLDSKASNLNKQLPYHQVNSHNIQTSAAVPPTSQMSAGTGELNAVIGLDMASHQAYAMPPPHVATFPTPQVYGGPPIFQSYGVGYLIPYHPQPYVPFVMPPGSVVPARQSTSQHSNQPSAHSRNHYQTPPQPQPNHPYRQSAPQHSNQPSAHSRNHYQTPPQPQPNHPYRQSAPQLSNQPSAHSRTHYQTPPQPQSNLPYRQSPPQHSNQPSAHSRNHYQTSSQHQPNHQGQEKNHLISSNAQNNKDSSQLSNKQPSQFKKRVKSTSSSDNDSTNPTNTDEFTKASAVSEDNDLRSHVEVSNHVEDTDSSSDQTEEPGTDTEQKNNYQEQTESENKSSKQEISNKSWADLFKHKNASLSFMRNSEGHNASFNEHDDESLNQKFENKLNVTDPDDIKTKATKEYKSQMAAKRSLDKFSPKLAQKISSIVLKHSLPFLKPRGFINKGNGCYINATLQALVACPPFYNLMREIGELRGLKRENSCTPIIDSFAEFFLNFQPFDASKKNKQQQSGSHEQKLSINDLQAETIEPKSIYNVLGHIKFECLKGAQEDAEEFLSSVLNGLHEEMVELSDILISNSQNTQNHNGQASDTDDGGSDVNLWHEVGPKNRSLPTRSTKVINTPIQEIFGGSLFTVRTAGKGDRCGHRQPFFALQLDISSDTVKSIQEAIKSFTAPEVIHDFYCSKTKQRVDASCKTSLDQLPPILILHLKQFVYSQDHGLKKLVKKIDYPMDFELPDSCLHDKHLYNKNLKSSRSYKLLAVVYHDGKEAIKGHYITDVYHIGTGQWIRCDDSNLKYISSPMKPEPPTTPYLLFYRRHNTLLIKKSASKDVLGQNRNH